MATTRDRCSTTWVTRISSTPSATPSWQSIASRISGDEIAPRLAASSKRPRSFVTLRFDRSLFIPKQVALSSRLRQGHGRARDCATNYIQIVPEELLARRLTMHWVKAKGTTALTSGVKANSTLDSLQRPRSHKRATSNHRERPRRERLIVDEG